MSGCCKPARLDYITYNNFFEAWFHAWNEIYSVFISRVCLAAAQPHDSIISPITTFSRPGSKRGTKYTRFSYHAYVWLLHNRTTRLYHLWRFFEAWFHAWNEIYSVLISPYVWLLHNRTNRLFHLWQFFRGLVPRVERNILGFNITVCLAAANQYKSIITPMTTFSKHGYTRESRNYWQ